MNAPDRFFARNRELALEMTESPRRRTLSIEVHPDSRNGARLVVRVPRGVTWDEVEPRVTRRAGWIAQQASHFDRFRPAPQPRQYLSGETFRLLGRQLVLSVRRGQHAVRQEGSRLIVTVPEPKSRDAIAGVLNRWYHAHAKAELVCRLEQWLHHALLQPAPKVRLQVKNLKRRWGSLSPAGTLTLNTKLVEAPVRCIDYVIAHELCHYWHPNHGEAFWQLMGDVLPDWQRRKHALEQVAIV